MGYVIFEVCFMFVHNLGVKEVVGLSAILDWYSKFDNWSWDISFLWDDQIEDVVTVEVAVALIEVRDILELVHYSKHLSWKMFCKVVSWLEFGSTGCETASMEEIDCPLA